MIANYKTLECRSCDYNKVSLTYLTRYSPGGYTKIESKNGVIYGDMQWQNYWKSRTVFVIGKQRKNGITCLKSVSNNFFPLYGNFRPIIKPYLGLELYTMRGVYNGQNITFTVGGYTLADINRGAIYRHLQYFTAQALFLTHGICM